MVGQSVGEPSEHDRQTPEETAYFASRARHHMLDVVEALNSISAPAHSSELEYGDNVKLLKPDRGEPLVRVKVGHGGDVQVLEIASSAMQVDMDKLSRVVVATIELAAQRAAQAHIKLMHQSYFAGEDQSENEHRNPQ